MKKINNQTTGSTFGNPDKRSSMVKLLLAAMLAGCMVAGLNMPAMADEEIEDIILGDTTSQEVLKNRTFGTPTLDYLKEKNILIPQKVYKLDENGNIVKENNYPVYDETKSETIKSSGSAYRFTDGSEENHLFEYKTVDKEGNISTKYYNIELLQNKGNGNSFSFGKSKNITWTELIKQPAEGTENVITVNFPNEVTKYYQYTLDKDYSPSNYTTVYDDKTTSAELLRTNSYGFKY